MKLFFIIVAVFAVAAMARPDFKEDDAPRALETSNNQFTAKMFSQVAKTNAGKSFVLSAFSVLPPLGQLALASVGDSHDELLNAIALPNDDGVKAVFSLVTGKVRSVKGVELKLATRVYIPEGSELNQDFAAVSRDVFASDVKNIDFSKTVEAAKEINTWVEDNTNKRIKDLVSPDALEGSSAVLVNAIYFKGNWANKFNVAATKDRDFHVTKDKTVQVPTMYRKGEYKYAESEELKAQLLEMPYEGHEASFLIILPYEIDGLADLEEKLKDPSAVERASKLLTSGEVNVYLPKFKIETETDLKNVLENLNITKLFIPNEAKLDNILKDTTNLYVSSAKQKAFIEIKEEGAEAAAANEFGISYLSAVIYEPPAKEFNANHPFVFAIVNGATTLFNGVYQS